MPADRRLLGATWSHFRLATGEEARSARLPIAFYSLDPDAALTGLRCHYPEQWYWSPPEEITAGYLPCYGLVPTDGRRPPWNMPPAAGWRRYAGLVQGKHAWFFRRGERVAWSAVHRPKYWMRADEHGDPRNLFGYQATWNEANSLRAGTDSAVVRGLSMPGMLISYGDDTFPDGWRP